jgi:hypothetical protein
MILREDARMEGAQEWAWSEYPTLMEAHQIASTSFAPGSAIYLTEAEKSKASSEGSAFVAHAEDWVEENRHKAKSEIDYARGLYLVGVGLAIGGILLTIVPSMAVIVVGLVCEIVGIILMLCSIMPAMKARAIAVELKDKGRQLERLKDRTKDERTRERIDRMTGWWTRSRRSTTTSGGARKKKSHKKGPTLAGRLPKFLNSPLRAGLGFYNRRLNREF